MIKKYLFKFIILFTIFASDAFGVSNAFKKAFIEGINAERKLRKQPLILPDSILSIDQKAKGGWAFASAIYEVKFKNAPPIICKQFEKQELCDIEIVNMQKLRKFVSQNNSNKIPGLPHLVEYKGCMLYTENKKQHYKLMLLEKAEGLDLFDFLEEFVLSKRAIKDPEVLKKWDNIGRQLARFHLYYGEIKEKSYYSCVHGDALFVNIIFQEKTGKTSFIDYHTLADSIINKKDISSEVSRFLNCYNHCNIHLPIAARRKAFKDSSNILDMNEREDRADLSIPIAEQKVINCITTLRDAYIAEFKEKGIILSGIDSIAKDESRIKVEIKAIHLPVKEPVKTQTQPKAPVETKKKTATLVKQAVIPKPVGKTPVKKAPAKPVKVAVPQNPVAKTPLKEAQAKPGKLAETQNPKAKTAVKKAPAKPGKVVVTQKPRVKTSVNSTPAKVVKTISTKSPVNSSNEPPKVPTKTK